MPCFTQPCQGKMGLVPIYLDPQTYQEVPTVFPAKWGPRRAGTVSWRRDSQHLLLLLPSDSPVPSIFPLSLAFLSLSLRLPSLLLPPLFLSPPLFFSLGTDSNLGVEKMFQPITWFLKCYVPSLSEFRI